VTFAGWNDGYGMLVVLSLGGGVTTWYAHLSRIDLRPGACVGAGAGVGAVGATGRATGPHLHFEVRVRDAAIDPAPLLG
jgi:murein DD-endopeptidase MepM/ murein hydrolase activator NlpD